MIWWIEYTGLHGIREDTCSYADQRFLADWGEAILTEYPDVNIVGEIWKSHTAFTALFQWGTPLPRDLEPNLPTVMDFALSDAWRAYMSGWGNLERIYQILALDYLYAATDSVMTFIGNHDMPRAAFIADDRHKIRRTPAMLLTTRGIPQILYGTEIGMVGGESHVELRPTCPALTRGDLIHFPPTWNHNVYRHLGQTEDQTILVVVNGYEDYRVIAIDDIAPHLPAGTRFVDLVTGEALPLDPAAGVPVEAWGSRVLLVR